MTNIKAAKYTNNAISDSTSISILKSLIVKKKMVSYLNENDKTPNYDGYIEVLDNEQYSLGKIEVQVKTLKKSSNSISHNVKLSLLAYSKESQLPFILILVDQVNKKAYWKELDRNISNTLIDKALNKSKNQKSIAINFEITKEISSERVYEDWKNIIINQKHILHNFDNLNNELIIKKSEIENILSQSNKTENNPYYRQVHVFIDTLNDLFSKDFKVVRHLFISEFWKFGIVILSIKENNISYSLFTIGREENQKQIIHDKSNSNDLISLSAKYNNIRAFSGKNPILDNPEYHAYERCWDYVKVLLNKKILWPNNHCLEREYLFYIKDTTFSTTQNEPQYINLVELKNQIEVHLSNVPESEKKIMIDFPESTFNLYRALDYIQLYRMMGLEKVSRLSPSKKSIQNISILLREKSSVSKNTINIIYNFWSTFIESYENTTNQYFPQISKKISFLNENDRLIVVPVNKFFSSEKSSFSVPYFLIYKLRNTKPSKSRKIVIEPDSKAIKFDVSLRAITYKNKQYLNWERETAAVSSFIDEMPIRKLVYNELFKNIEAYFKQKNTF